MCRASNAAVVLGVVLGLAGAPQSGAAQVEPPGSKPYLFDIFDQFVISAAAMKACSEPDASIRARHEGNFAVVARHVRRTLLSSKYGMSVIEIDRLLAGRKAALAEDVTGEIARHGCSNPDIRMVVLRYKAQADWRPPR